VRRAWLVAPVLVCLGAWAAPLHAAEQPRPRPAEAKNAVPAELAARIRKLIEDLADDNYYTRAAAHKALRKIGRPALERLQAATRDADAERAWRAKDLVYTISRLPDPSKVDPNCTNGYMPVYGTCQQIQTFKAPADAQIDTIRFRAARTLAVPFGPLELELHAGDKPGEKPLATATFTTQWANQKGGVTGVTRFLRWFEAKAKVPLRKGATYSLVFRSPAARNTSPWLINCFYRDTFPAGAHRRQDGDELESLGKHDLVFELRAGGRIVLTSVPAKVDLGKQEHFGLGHDGADLRENAAGQVVPP